MIMYKLKNDEILIYNVQVNDDMVKAFKEQEIKLIPQDQLFYRSISTEGKIFESSTEFNYNLDNLIFNDGKDCYGDLFSYQNPSKEYVLANFYKDKLIPRVYNIYFNNKKLYSLVPREYYQFNGVDYKMDNIIRITELLNDYYTFINMLNNHNLHVLKIPNTLDTFITFLKKDSEPLFKINSADLKSFYQLMTNQKNNQVDYLKELKKAIIKYGLYQVNFDQEMQEINTSTQILSKIKK